MSHLMRLWHFSSFINSFSKRACASIHAVWLDVWFLVGLFVYFHILCVWIAKSLARLRGCAGSPEPSLVAYVINTIISWAGSNWTNFVAPVSPMVYTKFHRRLCHNIRHNQYTSLVKRICVFEHSVMTNFNCACSAIQRGQGSSFLSEGSSWLTACMSEQRRFWQDCADAQARLNLRCSHRR